MILWVYRRKIIPKAIKLRHQPYMARQKASFERKICQKLF